MSKVMAAVFVIVALLAGRVEARGRGCALPSYGKMTGQSNGSIDITFEAGQITIAMEVLSTRWVWDTWTKHCRNGQLIIHGVGTIHSQDHSIDGEPVSGLLYVDMGRDGRPTGCNRISFGFTLEAWDEAEWLDDESAPSASEEKPPSRADAEGNHAPSDKAETAAERRARERRERAEAERQKREEAERARREERERKAHEKELRDSFRGGSERPAHVDAETARLNSACLNGDQAACDRLDPKAQARKKVDEARDRCLAQPVTTRRSARTNKFLSYAGSFQSLLQAAEGKCAYTASWSQWHDCIADVSSGAYWSAEAPAEAAHEDLFKRYWASSSDFKGNVCLDQPVKGVRSECTLTSGSLAVVRANCVGLLRRAVEQMNCDWKMLAAVWDAEDVARDRDAAKRRDEDCRKRFPASGN